jgi:hypothetical protein
MKLKWEQQESIENLLGSITKYHETYEELYDHIISALETVPDDTPFAGALYNIVENELGGKPGINKIEVRYVKVAAKEIIKRYFKYLGQYLMSPFTLVVFALTGGLYWLTKGENQPTFIVTVCLAINMVLMKLREKWTNKEISIGTYNKSSVIKTVYPYLAMSPILLSVGLGLIHIALNLFGIPYFDPRPYIDLTVFFINLFNMLICYRLWKDEFKLVTTT